MAFVDFWHISGYSKNAKLSHKQPRDSFYQLILIMYKYFEIEQNFDLIGFYYRDHIYS